MKQRALSLEQRLLASMHEVEERERETLSRLARAIEFRDAGTSAYLERMARVAGLIAEQLGLPEDDVRLIEMAAPLHDMGKIAIPDAVLLKQGKLNDEELAIMRRHPRIGHELLSGSQNRFIRWARSSRCAITSAMTAAAIPTAWSAKRSRWKRGSLLSPMSSTHSSHPVRTRKHGPWKPHWPICTHSVAACSIHAAWMR